MAKANVLGIGNAKAGAGTLMSSDPLFVSANTVLVAGFMSNATVATAGAGFNERIKTTTGYAEDRDIVSSGSYVGDATQSNTGAYIVDVAAFAGE